MEDSTRRPFWPGRRRPQSRSRSRFAAKTSNLNLMAEYRPDHRATGIPELARRITTAEYSLDAVKQAAPSSVSRGNLRPGLRAYDSLLRLRRDPRLDDLMERTFFNTLFAAQNPGWPPYSLLRTLQRSTLVSSRRHLRLPH